MPHLPLANIRVLEIAEGFAGPWAATLLGDLGAEVIKIEAVQRMDQTRGQVSPRPNTPTYPNGEPGPRPWNINQPFVRGNRNKLSLTLDLSREWGIDLFKRLVAVADVVLTNMVTGVPEKLGIGYQTLREIRPDLIMMSSSGFGSTGPYARFVAMAGSMDAISGHMWLRNYEGEEPPTASYTAHTDAVNAVTSAFGIASAVYHRNLTGQGQHLDVSGCEAILPHLGEALMDYTMNGRVQSSIGDSHPRMSPHMVYPTMGEDQWIAIAVKNQTQWQALCRVGSGASLPPSKGAAWTTDPRYRTVLGRWRNRDELDESLTHWTQDFTNDELATRLQEVGVPAAAVLSNKDTLFDPHIRSRGFFETTRQADLGEMEMSGLGWKMSETPGSIRMPPPLLGEHNDLLYRDLLGLDEREMAKLDEGQYAGRIPLDRPV